MAYVNRKEAGRLAGQREFFSGGNIFGDWEGDGYIVYSYGKHFPMAAWYDKTGWVVNADKYSSSTSRHQSEIRRNIPASAHKLNTSQIKTLIYAAGDPAVLLAGVDDVRDLAALGPLLEMAAG